MKGLGDAGDRQPAVQRMEKAIQLAMGTMPLNMG